jgi:hypothetical protein
MASEQQVKRYLAYWLQLGKRVVIPKTNSALLPEQVIAGDRYSDEFEQLWQSILSPESGDCYLEGTPQTIAELLTPRWDVESCVRCEMPVPMINVGLPPESCPCSDLLTWPNTDIPKPREPISSLDRLREIRSRLGKFSRQPESSLESSLDASVDSSTLSTAPPLTPEDEMANRNRLSFSASSHLEA